MSNPDRGRPLPEHPHSLSSTLKMTTALTSNTIYSLYLFLNFLWLSGFFYVTSSCDSLIATSTLYISTFLMCLGSWSHPLCTRAFLTTCPGCLGSWLWDPQCNWIVSPVWPWVFGQLPHVSRGPWFTLLWWAWFFQFRAVQTCKHSSSAFMILCALPSLPGDDMCGLK